MSLNHEHPHRHPYQKDHDEPSTYHQLLGLAINELLLEKGIYSSGELRKMIEKIESVDASTHGAKVIAKAWTNDEFKKQLLENANEAIENLGLDPGAAELKVLENTPTLHNVVVCTLCSCYPRALLGRPPTWYKSKVYRARVVREPRAVLKEFGTEIDDNVEVRVHDSTAELRYIVLPLRPPRTETMSLNKLARMIDRDSMIGVTVPRAH